MSYREPDFWIIRGTASWQDQLENLPASRFCWKCPEPYPLDEESLPDGSRRFLDVSCMGLSVKNLKPGWWYPVWVEVGG